MKAAFGIIGLGVMGKSLSRNMASKGIKLALYNRFVAGEEEQVAKRFISKHEELHLAEGFEDLVAFANALQPPRKILLMVSAGAAVDALLHSLIPVLDAGDVIIDGGNTFFEDTERRIQAMGKSGLFYIGAGISGGEEGALKGPSIMPGGSEAAWPLVSEPLQKIAAQDPNGKPCCTFVGNGGAGHFVKMVHNGIEYAEMQLIAEMYGLLRHAAGKNPAEIASLFESWLDGPAGSYLLEITTNILRTREGDHWLIDRILDQAGNKGTGSWTTMTAARAGVAIPGITAALFARFQSAFRQNRLELAATYPMPKKTMAIDTDQLLHAYQLARLLNHHQGFKLIETQSDASGWTVNLSELARIWTNGCIIRSAMMEQLQKVFGESQKMLLHPYSKKWIEAGSHALPDLCASALKARVPVPCFSASANYFLLAVEAKSTANIIQAQRDYFGAHTYKRSDDPTGKSYHTNWNSKDT
ncbi:MAG: NADP-dependent phosphogluconate dehydrogenase [Bacteroidetes bacterium]|nr:NADP-dependent phosphogluconate dehydrogenase [Bacteroidota bacterium]